MITTASRTYTIHIRYSVADGSTTITDTCGCIVDTTNTYDRNITVAVHCPSEYASYIAPPREPEDDESELYTPFPQEPLQWKPWQYRPPVVRRYSGAVSPHRKLFKRGRVRRKYHISQIVRYLKSKKLSCRS